MNAYINSLYILLTRPIIRTTIFIWAEYILEVYVGALCAELSLLCPAVAWIIYHIQKIKISAGISVFHQRLSNRKLSWQVLICYHQVNLLDTTCRVPNWVIRIALLNFQSKKESKHIWKSAMNMNLGYGAGYPLMPFDPNFPPAFNPFSFPKGWCWFLFFFVGLVQCRSFVLQGESRPCWLAVLFDEFVKVHQ